MADINKIYLSSLILAYLLQFQNVTLLTSPLLSLLIGSMLARYFQVKFCMFKDIFFCILSPLLVNEYKILS